MTTPYLIIPRSPATPPLGRQGVNFQRPFSALSPWNRPVASYSGVSRTTTTAFAGITNPALGSWPSSLWVGMYHAQASDPLVTLYFNADGYTNVANGTWQRYGNNPTIEAAILGGSDQLWAGFEYNEYSTAVSGGSTPPAVYHHRTADYWALTAHIPASALPPTDIDGHWTVLQPNGWMLEMFSPIVLSTGQVVCFFVSYTDATGLGDGTANGRRASMLPNYGGIIRDGEFTAGVIPHALTIGVGPECLSAGSVNAPAVAMDTNTVNYSGPLPMGTFLTIAPGVNLATLGLTTPEGMAMAVAAQTYGMYLSDSTGGGNFLVLTQANAADLPGFSFAIANDIALIMTTAQVTTHS